MAAQWCLMLLVGGCSSRIRSRSAEQVSLLEMAHEGFAFASCATLTLPVLEFLFDSKLKCEMREVSPLTAETCQVCQVQSSQSRKAF